jgi:predicted metal-dependent peptidase
MNCVQSIQPPIGKNEEEKSDLEQIAAADPGRIDALRERISMIRTKMTVTIPFFGHLLLKLDIRPAEPGMGIATAGVTRDRKLYMNLDFCEKLSDAELSGVLVHEVMHPAYLCFERQGSRVAMIHYPDGSRLSVWNAAHDYAINGIIEEFVESGRSSNEIKLPNGGLVDRKKYGGMSAEEIYDQILGSAKKGGDGKGPVIVLPQDSWGMDDMRPDLGDKEQEGGGSSEAEQRSDDNFWKGAVVEASIIHEQQKGKGSLPAGIQKLVDEITDPKVAWQDVLSRWVGENGKRDDFTYTRPSRRSDGVGEILPSLRRNGVDQIVIGWDTSGSMNGREREIFSEVLGICEDLHMELRVICCDTQIHSDQSGVQDVTDIDIRGGGGSDYCPMFERLEEEGYDGVVVCFTDGYINVPATKPPQIRAVLWVIWDERRDVDPTQGRWGETLIVSKDGYQLIPRAEA